MQKVLIVLALLATSPALSCDLGPSVCPGPLDTSSMSIEPKYDDTIEMQDNSYRPSGGTYVQSGNIGNWYGDNGSHCVSTNFNGIVNVSCY